MEEKHLIIHTDGGSRGNPGPGAIGYTIENDQGFMIYECGKPIGVCTNNEAEYKALVDALEKAKEIGAENIAVLMDSELIVKQILGVYKIKSKNLLDDYQSIKKSMGKLNSFSIQHVPREENKRADQLVNMALDENRTCIFINGEKEEENRDFADSKEMSAHKENTVEGGTPKTTQQNEGIQKIMLWLETAGYKTLVPHKFGEVILFRGSASEKMRLIDEQEILARVVEKLGFAMGGLAFEQKAEEES